MLTHERIDTYAEEVGQFGNIKHRRTDAFSSLADAVRGKGNHQHERCRKKEVRIIPGFDSCFK